MQLADAASGIHPRIATGPWCGVGEFNGISMKRLSGKSGPVQGIDGDLTAMTCGRIDPDEMTDPASDIRYHGGSAAGETANTRYRTFQAFRLSD